jgi:uncharacterized protein
MKIAPIGATGNVGSKILTELLNRGHQVTGIVRNTEKLAPHDQLTARQGYVNDENSLAKILPDHDEVICSTKFMTTKAYSLIESVKKASVPRLLVVGGASSLEVSPSLKLLDSPTFPSEYKAEATAGRDFLNVLRGTAIGLDLYFAVCDLRTWRAHRSIQTRT